MAAIVNKLQVRRGLKRDLPVLDVGEFGFCTDTDEVFMGTEDKGNQKVPTMQDLLKYVTLEQLADAGGGDMLRAVYDPDNTGKVRNAVDADKVPWSGIIDKPSALDRLTYDGTNLLFDGKPISSGGGSGEAGSGYGVFINADVANQMMTASKPNDILKWDGEGLTSVALIPKIPNDSSSRDTVKITSRFPTWQEIMGDPLTLFNKKEFIFENNTIGVNPAVVGGGGAGGGLPYINVKGFSVFERNPTTGVLEEVKYAAKGDNSSPDLDTKAFKRAFDLAKEQGSVNIYIPDGNYILKETVNVYRNTNVQASRNATIKKNHLGVMFANTNPDEAFIGYDGGRLLPTRNTSIKNNGNVFFDGGIWDNDGTSGSTFSFINAANFEFKNLTVKDILDSHAFDLCGIADMVIYNCNFLGFDYKGSKNHPDPNITDAASQIKAYSECIQLDYSSFEGYPYQLSGHDGTACKRIRVDKCVFGKSDRFPAWNRAYGGHNTYIPTYDWLHQTDGNSTGNLFNFKDCKPKDVYFLNNVVEGNGTLKYDYDQNDPQSFIIQQVRFQCVDNAIIMNNKLRNSKGGISIDVDQTPKTMSADALKKNFNLTGTATVPKSGVMPAKVTYLDAHGDMQTIMFSETASDQDMSKITTHVHDGITYTVIWCKTTKFVSYYGWQNALIMNNELTNITCGIFNMKQVTATTTNSTVINQIVVQDINDVLGNTLIKSGAEIYIGTETNPRFVTAVAGTPFTDMEGNATTISPYTITVYPAFTTLPLVGTPIYLKDSPSKNASTPIYVRGKATPYSKVDKITTNGVVTWKYTATTTAQAPRGKKCIIYGNIIDGLEQKTVYSQYEDVIKNGRSVTTISAMDATKTILTLSAVTDRYMKVGENLYYDGNLATPYQIMAVDSTAKKVTVFPALPSTAVTGKSVYCRKPIMAGESGGASIINAIQGGYIHDLLIQKNIVRNIPRAIYISGSTRMNILGNHFFQVNEVEAVCIDGGDYSNIIGNTFSDLNDQAIEMRNTNYFNIANNEFLNTNKGVTFESSYREVDFTYDPLDSPTVTVMGDGTDGIYGTITGNMFVHNNSQPIAYGIQAPETTKFIKMSNNSFPSEFTVRQDNRSDVGLDYGYRGNDADTLGGKTLDTLADLFLPATSRGTANGVASLDTGGKVPTSQLPTSIGGGGFKQVTAPSGLPLLSSSVNTAASTLNIQVSGGLTAETKDGNVLMLGFQPADNGGEVTVEGLASQVSFIQQDVDQLKADEDVIVDDLNVVKGWKTTMTDTTLPGINFNIGAKANTADVDSNYLKKTGATEQNVDPKVNFKQDVTLTKYEEKLGTATNGVCDLSTGNVFNISVASATTLSFTNLSPTSGFAQSMVLYLTMGATAYSVTFPASVKWHNQTLPSMGASTTYEIVLRSVNNGTTWLASVGGSFY